MLISCLTLSAISPLLQLKSIDTFQFCQQRNLQTDIKFFFLLGSFFPPREFSLLSVPSNICREDALLLSQYNMYGEAERNVKVRLPKFYKV